jgi:hypothetical protein
VRKCGVDASSSGEGPMAKSRWDFLTRGLTSASDEGSMMHICWLFPCFSLVTASESWDSTFTGHNDLFKVISDSSHIIIYSCHSTINNVCM